MSVFTVVLLGIIQGVAEFLPISSSGHLAIAEHLLGMQEVAEIPDFFDVLLHLGTLLAVFAAYWHEIWEIVFEFFRGVGDLVRHTMPERVPPARRMALLIILSSLPMFSVLLVRRRIEALSDNMYFIGGALLFTGALLWLCDRVKKGSKKEKTAGIADALLVGCAQVIATCPGISRSGMTISAGCFLGFERSFAVRYAFILSIPAVLAANFLTLLELAETGVDWSAVPVYCIGVAVSAAVGYCCIRLLRYVADRGCFGAFAYYCWAVGILTLVLTAAQG